MGCKDPIGVHNLCVTINTDIPLFRKIQITMFKSPYFAAIDLGSNSFHMLIARYEDGHFEVVDREKEMVQIARGLQDNGSLDDEARKRALDCLHRFSERLRDIPSEQVRAVGTKTLRAARKSASFIKEAEQQLGHPIQIISGFEEARLVYCGLSHQITNDTNQRLVIDIGGGSTEFVIGKGYDPQILESLSLGCVSFTNRYFNTAKSYPEKMNKAYMAACSELESIRSIYLKKGWKLAYGTSGTMKAIGELVAPNDASIIDHDGLKILYKEIIKNEGLNDKDLPKLRRDVLPAGVAILKAIFDQLKIERLHVASSTLKEGLIFDTVGRFSQDDSRESTVNLLVERYAIDQEQSKRVDRTSAQLWKQIKGQAPDLSGVSRTKVLHWASRLHEIGLSVSHGSHHNHGYYLLQHSDLAGFGRYEQYIFACLVRFHRKKIRLESFEELDSTICLAFIPLLVCLRLAVRFCRRREDFESKLKLELNNTSFTLTVDAQWLDVNPMTRAGLIREIELLEAIGVHLELKSKKID